MPTLQTSFSWEEMQSAGNGKRVNTQGQHCKLPCLGRRCRYGMRIRVNTPCCASHSKCHGASSATRVAQLSATNDHPPICGQLDPQDFPPLPPGPIMNPEKVIYRAMPHPLQSSQSSPWPSCQPRHHQPYHRAAHTFSDSRFPWLPTFSNEPCDSRSPAQPN